MKREVIIGNIRVNERHDGNVELDTVHIAGLIRRGAVVVERADVDDLILALQAMRREPAS